MRAPARCGASLATVRTASSVELIRPPTIVTVTVPRRSGGEAAAMDAADRRAAPLGRIAGMIAPRGRILPAAVCAAQSYVAAPSGRDGSGPVRTAVGATDASPPSRLSEQRR